MANERYYPDQNKDNDPADEDWYVFDSEVEPHKAVSSWSDEQAAKDDAARRNEAITERPEEKPKTKVTIEVEVDDGWIDFAVYNNDLFRTSYCGYWLYGVEFDDDLGWLCYVDGNGGKPKDAQANKAIKAWKAGEKFPDNKHGKFYLLDRQAAIEAFKQGVIWRGAEWYENGDANAYDHVIQMALLGDIVYG